MKPEFTEEDEVAAFLAADLSPKAGPSNTTATNTKKPNPERNPEPPKEDSEDKTDSEEDMPELKIVLPEKFSGVRNMTESFLSGCDLYLEINDAIYNTDKKKIGFILSLLTSDALEWCTAIMDTMKSNKGKSKPPA